MNNYTLYRYTDEHGKTVVSAVHWRDGFKFRAQYPNAVALKAA